MIKKYKVTPLVRVVNVVMRTMIRLDVGPKGMHLLEVRGRKSGKLYSTPVTLVEENGTRWLVAPYGDVGWVQNARAAGQVTLKRSGHAEVVALTAVGSQESAPVLKKYIALEPITRPYFTAGPDSPLDAFAVEAFRHPVFRLSHA